MALDRTKIGKPRATPEGRKPDYPKFTAGEYELELENIEEAKTKFGPFLFVTAKIVTSTGKKALAAGTVGKWRIKLERPEDKGGEGLVLQHVENLLAALNGGPGFDGDFYANLLANPSAAKGTKFRLNITHETAKSGFEFDSADFQPA